jgi:hypothetical protein
MLHPGLRTAVKGHRDSRYNALQSHRNITMPKAKYMIGMLPEILAACDFHFDSYS